MTITKQCAYCGKEFNAAYKESKYCSKDCSHKGWSAYVKERNARMKIEQELEAEEKRNKKKRLAEDASKAREMKMSYGQYKAMIFKEMMR